MKKDPLISVIIPSYNYGHFLDSSIRSVLSQRGNGFKTEIIVIDDGSKDNTPSVAQGFGKSVNYIYQDNQGLAGARNTGIKNATGDFIVFLDADDLLTPDYIKNHLENFRKNEAVDISVCHCLLIDLDNKGTTLWPLKGDNLALHLCQSNVAPVHAFMTRGDAIRQAGFFDIERKACEDYDFWLRLAGMGKRMAVVTNTFAIYRRHASSMTGQTLQQRLSDMSARLEIRKLLEASPDFPGVPKYYGWLAYAAGTIASSQGLAQRLPKLAMEMVRNSAEALLEGANHYSRAKADTPHLIQSERFYACEYFYHAKLFGQHSSPVMAKALGFLSSHYSLKNTASLDQLQARRGHLFQNLLAEHDSISPELQSYGLLEA